MDHSRFDDITRTLAAPSRRSLLSVAGVAALAALLGRDDADARRKRKKKKKPKSRTGNCVGRDCGPDGCGGNCGVCGERESCSEGTCVCVPACAGKACGSDGCDGSCGGCIPGDTCQTSSCVCATAGGRGPGELCDADSQCCPYPGVARYCSRSGKASCLGFLKACRYGIGGKCSGDCDCEGEMECQNGACQCPSDRVPHPSGGCCQPGRLPCGPRCCFSGDCLCFGGLTDCRCINFP